MTWADYVIVAIIGISMLISLFRGYVREMLSLIAWGAAFWVAFTFSHKVAVLLVEYVDLPSARLVLAFVALFLATLLVGGLVNFLAGELVDKTGLSGTDRMLGLLFGMLRGIAVVVIMVLLAGLTPVPADPWWRESQLLGHFQDLALWLRDYLPRDVAAYISYG